MTTVAEEKARLRAEWEEGTTCRCCGQRVQLYRRKLNSGMARALIVMYRAHGLEWQDKTVTLSGVGAAARDEPLLRFWGLLEEDTRTREDGGRAGWWRVTEKGAAFIRQGTRVPKYAKTFNSQCYGLEGESITIRDALGDRFDLEELLYGTY